MPSKSLYERFLTVLGDIKVYPWPMFLMYQPLGYQVKGKDVRDVVTRVKPGDILVRGFRSYLDGYFIPGYFSHVGLYLGDVVESDREHVVKSSRAFRDRGEPRFETGPQMVIHAVAEGVVLEDILNFCRCDYMAILRFPKEIRVTTPGWEPAGSTESFSAEERAISDRLRLGSSVSFDDVFEVIRRSALGELGTPYDFGFDFDRFDKLSCSELTYYATKCVGPFLDVSPENRRVLFLKRSLILPDAFISSPLELVWESPSVDGGRLAELRATSDSTRLAGR